MNQIWCIGRNYKKHAQELGNEVPKEPVIFIKSISTINSSNKIHLPSWAKDVHHEVELALLLGENLKPTHFTIALDLTERHLQSELKSKGLPWAKAKSFTGACPMGEWTSLGATDLTDLELVLMVNDTIRQKSSTNNMIFSPESLIQHLKDYFTLTPGDIILTGTPEGVGPLKPGDHVRASITSHIQCEWEVIQNS